MSKNPGYPGVSAAIGSRRAASAVTTRAMAWCAPDVTCTSSASVTTPSELCMSAIAVRRDGSPSGWNPGPAPHASTSARSIETGGRCDTSAGFPTARSIPPAPAIRWTAMRLEVSSSSTSEPSATNVPRPWCDVSTPSARSTSSAAVTVERLTASSSASRRSGGSGDPGASRPASITRRKP